MLQLEYLTYWATNGSASQWDSRNRFRRKPEHRWWGFWWIREEEHHSWIFDTTVPPECLRKKSLTITLKVKVFCSARYFPNNSETIHILSFQDALVFVYTQLYFLVEPNLAYVEQMSNKLIRMAINQIIYKHTVQRLCF